MFEVKRYFLILGLFCRACRSFFARSDKRTAIHVQYPEAQYSRYQPKMFETILELKRSFNGSEYVHSLKDSYASTKEIL
ncbi:hypothetical protein OUZ56_001755 [Daphnia magna]|uniref:Secreted protein n=1 Tax=Daphnia magna TaxID=35525 RepID=A0ABR0A3M5_9CRUS|nr:hypothetical protein OUZ56_001755 [Daphnia magna]